MPDQPTGTVTFLFTDIEGSTRLWERDPDQMRGVLARHDELLRKHITDSGGYVFTTAGDAFSAAFSDSLAGVVTAIAVQKAMATEHWEIGEVRVRMALHAGVAHERDGDYFGPTLNRTARILSAGHGGQILLSQATRDLMVGRLPAGVDVRSLGEYRLKDLGSPEQLHQIVHPDLVSDFPDLRTLDGHLNNLPVELSSFIGRHDELAETVKRLRESRLVTLTGVGGSGKTRLALQTAAEVFDDFPDGVWVAEMAGLTEAERFPRWIAEEMGLARSAQSGLGGGSDERSSMEIVLDYLAARTALLVLDNCEHLIASSAEFAERALRACPNLKILTTSREGLGIRGEYLIQVPSLRLPSSFGYEDEGGGYPDAMELFAERASAVNSRFTLTPDTAPAVADICRRLDGMPLAIELAAARTRMLTVDQISQRLGDTFRLLTGGSRTALPRQQTLLATVDWSYQLLTEEEKRLFERLAVFRAGFSMEAAEAIIAGQGVDEFEVFDLLASLVDKSMVQGASGSGRFGLLETLRQFALGKLTDAGSGDEWRERHAEYFATVADQAFDETRGRNQVEWLERLERDQDNFDAAITWSIESARYLLAARLAAGLWWYWAQHGHGKQGLEAMDLIVDHIDDFPPELQVRFLVGRAWVRGFETASDGGLADAERALVIATQIDSPTLTGLSQLAIALAHGHENRFDNALHHHRQGFLAFEGVGDEWGMGWTSLFPAWIYRMQADVETSQRWLEQARSHLRAAGSQFGLAWALSTLGIIRRYENDFEGSIRLHGEAAELFSRLGNRAAVSFSLIVTALSLDQSGQVDEALAAVKRGISIERDLGPLGGETASVGASISRHAGDLVAAHGYLQEVRGRFATENASNLAVVAEEIADIAVALGIYQPAAHLLAYAAAERIRVSRPVPSQFQPERDRTAALVTEHVDDVEAINTQWLRKTKEDVVPILGDTLDQIGLALQRVEGIG
jgi:predicted ATPase/class 3 adenylate cyclase